jgi:superoxide dismutase, Fe-Mn family
MSAHSLPTLDYCYDALEPHIDALTMEIHHSKHHQAYITNYTKLLEWTGLLEKYTPEELIQHLDEVPSDKKQGVINNLWGHINHSFFWTILTPNPLNRILATGQLSQAIQENFGSFDGFKEQFTQKAMTVFGSGWAWLVRDVDGNLVLRQAVGQNTPLSEGETPVIGIDVWEHAYYLKHQNKRADYVAAFWNVIDWKKAEENFSQ